MATAKDETKDDKKGKKRRREKGSGSVFRRGGGWVAQVLDGYKPDGSPRYRQERAPTQAEAVRIVTENAAKVAAGVPLPEGKGMRLGAWLDRWLADHVGPNREPRTLEFYSAYVEGRIKPKIGHLELRRVRPGDVARMLRELGDEGATPYTLLAVRRTLRAAFGLAVRMELCGDNPVTKTFAPKAIRRKKVYFDGEQARALLAALRGSPIEALVRFTLATGLRVGEATGVRWRNVDLTRGTVLIEAQLQRLRGRNPEGRMVRGEMVLKDLKTERSLRTLPLVGHSLDAVLGERARQAVELEPGGNPLGLVFLNPWGRPMDPKWVNARLHEALAAAGLPRTGMHALRHSAATFMLMAGLNLHQVSRYLGHSQIALTSDLYGHVLDGAMREAAERLQAGYADGEPGG